VDLHPNPPRWIFFTADRRVHVWKINPFNFDPCSVGKSLVWHARLHASDLRPDPMRRRCGHLRCVEDAARSDASNVEYPFRSDAAGVVDLGEPPRTTGSVRARHRICGQIRCVEYSKSDASDIRPNPTDRIFAQIRCIECSSKSDASDIPPDPMHRIFAQIRRRGGFG